MLDFTDVYAHADVALDPVVGEDLVADMAQQDEDEFDSRNDRRDRGERDSVARQLERQLNNMNTAFAVMSTEIKGFKENVDKKLNDIDVTIRDLASKFATKDEVETLRKDLKDLKNGINWAVKTVLGVVFVAVLGLLFSKAGLPH